MYEIMSDLGKYLVNRYALCLKGSNMPRPPLHVKCLNSTGRFYFFLPSPLSSAAYHNEA